MVVYVTYRVPVEVELEIDTGEIMDVHIVDEQLEGPLVRRLRERLSEWSELEGAWLSGSVARGDADGESDIDVLIVAEDLESSELHARVAQLQTDVRSWTGNELQLVEHSPESWRKLVRSKNPGRTYTASADSGLLDGRQQTRRPGQGTIDATAHLAKPLLHVEAERRSAANAWPLTCDAAVQSRGRVRRKYAGPVEDADASFVQPSVRRECCVCGAGSPPCTDADQPLPHPPAAGPFA